MARTVWAVVLTVVFCLGFGGVPHAHAKPVDELITEAEGLIDGGWVRTAIPLLEEAVEKAPANAEARFLLGVAYYESGMAKPARKAFTEAVRLDPDNWRAHYNLGAGYFADGMWDEAVAAFLAIPERAPHVAAAAYLNAGLARYKQGDVAAARDLFDRVLTTQAEGPDADKARAMLAVLDRPVVTGTATPPTPSATPPGDRPRNWRVAGSAGVDYDSNVFLSPDDQSGRARDDFRTVVTLRADYQMPLGDRYRLRPHYDLYGRWHTAESGANYLAHRVRLRVTDQQPAWRPRLDYTYSFAELGGGAYLASHELGGRVTLLKEGTRSGMWAAAHFQLFSAPGQRYEYLSGTEWEGSLSGARPAFIDGVWYGAVALRYLDRKDLTTASNGFRSYSYAAFEPFVQLSHPLPWLGAVDATAGLRYQYRGYLDADTWSQDPPGNPVTGNKTRYDHRAQASLALARNVSRNVVAELSWTGQVTHSNIGNDAIDYQDRDFVRNVIGIELTGTL
ncbi:MAG: tetratricopeptide repeat protein [Nitrospirae bacterium]|nr:tetratricopeptide repeat protein [Nitrospirota bacterium]